MKKVVVIGGGTGVFTVLSGLKNYPYELSAIVSMSDDGGSTGTLREEFGMLPPGDIRRALVALSSSDNKMLSELFNYRFEEGTGLKGHSLGNLLLTALERITGRFDVAVKEAVFPFLKFKGVDTLLGPEMKSTGEVMGLDKDFGRAYAKAQMSANYCLPLVGAVFISVRDKDKKPIVQIAKKLLQMGFKITATKGTAAALSEENISVTPVLKVIEGRPNIVDHIKNNEVQLVINTAEGKAAQEASFSIRRTALTHQIPYFTTVAGAVAAVRAIEALKSGTLDVRSIQECHQR